MSTKFDWSAYTSALKEFPPLTQYLEKELVEAIRSTIPRKPGLKILEVGCANGRWLRWFAREYNSDGYGLDLSTAGFKRDLDLLKGDALHLPYTDGSFDIVYSFGLVEHFQKEDRMRILHEKARVLSNGGYMICALPNLFLSLEYFWVKYFYDYKQGYRHFVVRPLELDRAFRDLGLEVKHFSYIGVFREIDFFKRLRIGPFRRLFSGEMLYICKK